MQASTPNQLCIVRHPICDRQQTVFAYDIVAGSTDARHGGDPFSDETISNLLINSLLDVGLAELTGTKLAFLPLSRNYVAGSIPLPEAWPHLGFEVRDGTLPDPILLPALKALSDNQTHPICLSDVRSIENRQPIIEAADFVKINVSNLSYTDLQKQVTALSGLKVKIIVTGISMPEMFDLCKKLQVDGFGGYYFSMPRKSQHQVIPAARMTILNVIRELENPDHSVEQLVKVIERDAGFGLRILRFMNSAYFNVPKKVDSIKRAVTLAGLKNIKTWALILAHSRLDDKPHELLITALIRAKMCELLAARLQLKGETGFIIGLFSTLDAMLDLPMEKVLLHLPLTDEVKTALLQGAAAQNAGFCTLLRMVLAYEKANWRLLDNVTLDGPTLQQAYLAAITWADSISAGLLSPDPPENVVSINRTKV